MDAIKSDQMGLYLNRQDKTESDHIRLDKNRIGHECRLNHMTSGEIVWEQMRSIVLYQLGPIGFDHIR